MNELFRALPSVDACLTVLEKEYAKGSSSPYLNSKLQLQQPPRPMLRDAVVEFLDQVRLDIKSGKEVEASKLNLEGLLSRLVPYVIQATKPRLCQTINATGVVIHTNMGRSVLPKAAAKAVAVAAAQYTNLELDLNTGARGSRQSIVESLLCRISGAEAAMVVNNNAAAVLIVLDELCKGGEVIVSRGQLVEIGGSFRIPDVLKRSGATLCEVGTTNRTHIKDYVDNINDNTVALLRVHTSNYRIMGFHKQVSLEEMVSIGSEYGLPVIEDLGSGSLVDLSPYGLPDEPTVQAAIEAGTDVVTFSGDKVLGGPQAGIIVGRKDLLERMRTNPLHRALRCDKFTLAALEATLRIYTDLDQAFVHVPTLRMITMSANDLAKRAKQLEKKLIGNLPTNAKIFTKESVSRVGGGAFPERDLPTTLVCIKPSNMSATKLKESLLTTNPPLIGRLEDDCFCLDPRTLFDNDVELIIDVLNTVFKVQDKNNKVEKPLLSLKVNPKVAK